MKALHEPGVSYAVAVHIRSSHAQADIESRVRQTAQETAQREAHYVNDATRSSQRYQQWLSLAHQYTSTKATHVDVRESRSSVAHWIRCRTCTIPLRFVFGIRFLPGAVGPYLSAFINASWFVTC